MASLNLHTIIGRLGKDVELKPPTKEGGVPYAYFSVATDDYIGRDDDNKAKTETTWHDVKAFGKLAEIIGKYGKKGTSVYVAGRGQHKKDEKSDKVYYNIIAEKILLLSDKESNGNGHSNGNGATATESSAPAKQSEPTDYSSEPVPAGVADSSNDLPF